MLYIFVDNAVQTIKAELDSASPCVSIWNDTAQHLLHGIQSADAEQASNRLTDISRRLQHLNSVCTSHLQQVELALDGSIPHQVRVCYVLYNKEMVCTRNNSHNRKSHHISNMWPHYFMIYR